jgi:hypothetical protein
MPPARGYPRAGEQRIVAERIGVVAKVEYARDDRRVGVAGHGDPAVRGRDLHRAAPVDAVAHLLQARDRARAEPVEQARPVERLTGGKDHACERRRLW